MGRLLIERILEASVSRVGPGIGISPASPGDSDAGVSLLFRRAPWSAHSRAGPPPPSRGLTNAHVLVVQLRGAVAVVAQAAVLAVLASCVVLAADAGHHVQEVDVAAAIRVAIALAVWAGQTRETPRVREQMESVPSGCPLPGAFPNTEARGRTWHRKVPWVSNTSVPCGERWAC